MQAPATSLTHSLPLPHTPALNCVSTGLSWCNTRASGVSVHAKLGSCTQKCCRSPNSSLNLDPSSLDTELNCTTDPQLLWQLLYNLVCRHFNLLTTADTSYSPCSHTTCHHNSLPTLSLANTGRYTPACCTCACLGLAPAPGASPKHAHAQHGGVVGAHTAWHSPPVALNSTDPHYSAWSQHSSKRGSKPRSKLPAQRRQLPSCSKGWRHQACCCSW